MMITHWALSLWQLESTLSGRYVPLVMNQNIGEAYDQYGFAWEFLLPLVTETVLFGFASSLFVITAYTYFWPTLSQWRSCFPLIIPAMASVMYTLSLVHWAITIRFYTVYAGWAAALSTQITEFDDVNIPAFEVALLVLFSVNAVMSDSIVIWRMCVVWDRARPVLAFGSALLVTTLGLNIANIVVNARVRLDISASQIHENDHDTEIISTYGGNYLGLAAAFISLGSNLCATMLVGIKAWLHRRKFPKHLRSDNRRTLVERVMALLVDSGVVYTAIWLLYCVSFFRKISTHPVLGQDPNATFPQSVTVVDHLDAAMAQITSIYPLMVFILVALDKIHHSRGPRALRTNEWPKERGPAVTVTFEVDVERSMALEPTSTHPMLALSSTNDAPPSVDDTKIAVSGEA
ncbi:hypothetical protein PENSPDRAFT_654467 [Peniophora sp. CONT]|nr:hypothetical protein PENSPDRAFT_654467 [Peniophora sp. CONT]